MTTDVHFNDRRRIDVALAETLGSGLDETSRSIISTLWKTSILPSLEENARRRSVTDAQRQSQLQLAGKLTRELFEALHRKGRTRTGNQEVQCFWAHQSTNVHRSKDDVSGMSIHRAGLQEVAVEYLNHPEVRSNKLDWMLLDAMVFHELEVQGSDMRTYLTLATLIGTLKSLFVYLLLPALAYILFTREHQTLGTTVGVIGSITVVIHLVGAPFRSHDLKRGRTFLHRLQDLYALLGNRTISPIELSASLDKATAAGVVLDRAVFTLVDRMTAEDSTAFFPEQVRVGSPVV